jgi:hypothetical protein
MRKYFTLKNCAVLEESAFSLRGLLELTRIDLFRVTDLARRANLLRPMVMIIKSKYLLAHKRFCFDKALRSSF